MDNFDDVLIVDLDDNRDPDCAISSGESGSEEHIDLDDQKETADLDAGDDQYKKVIDLTADEIQGLEFGSEGEAYQFYHTYAKFHGFLIRKDDVSRDFKGNIIMRQFVCNREGLRSKKHLMRVDRKREHRPITRTNCQARLRIHLSYKTSKWKVVSFEDSHNHELTPSKIPAYRVKTNANKAQVDNLHSNDVRTCHILGYMLAQKRGYASVGILKKDLYNYFDQHKHGWIKDEDAHAALSYLQGKADHDPMFYSKYTTTTDGRLEHLFWVDGGSIGDFQCFGDVLVFDTTYNKNKYNYGLVIFSGCNHHSQTIIFGCALVSDETVGTYKWVLESFLEAMCSKHPKAVVIDGDGAMRDAIKHVFPDASHRLCAWHLHNAACENVNNSPFLEDFKTAIYYNFTPDEFEEYWKKMVVKHELVGNKWICETYENKSLWAAAYLRDKFFGRTRTMSQCEAINSLIKAYVRKKSTIVEFMHNFQQALREYRNSELAADFKSLFSEPVLTTSLYKIEHEASKIYTLEIFKEVKHEIEEVGALNLIERIENGEKLMFKLNKYGRPDNKIHVVYDTTRFNFSCDCRLFESRGIPCSHIICAMKHEHMDCIPSSLIYKRWTKTAKSDFISSDQSEEIDSGVMKVACFGAIGAACNKLCDIVVEKSEYFNEIRDEIFKLTKKYENLGDSCSKHRSSIKDIDDPTLVKTIHTPGKKMYGKKRRHCSNCYSTRHTIRRCPRLLGTDDQSSKDDELSPSESSGINREVDSDKEVTQCDENNDHDTVLTNCSTSHDVNKGIEKLNGDCKRNEKKVKCSQNSVKHAKIQPADSSNGAKQIPQQVPILPRPQNLTFGYGTLSQGVSSFPSNSSVPVFPHYGGVPLYPTLPIFPQIPQYMSGVQNVSSGISWNGSHEEVTKNRGQEEVTKNRSQTSGKRGES